MWLELLKYIARCTPSWVYVLCGIVVFALVGAVLSASQSQCEPAEFSRGYTVEHVLSQRKGIVQKTFCAGSAPDDYRALRVDTGLDTTYSFWPQASVKLVSEGN